MRARLLHLALFLAGCTSSAIPPAPAAPASPTFTIQLHRPAAIGDTRELSTTLHAEQSVRVTSGDIELANEQEDMRITFHATEKVLDIHDNGTPTRTEYTVKEAFTESDEATQELLPVGAVLMVSRGVEQPFSLREGSLTPEAERLLGMVLTTTEPTRTDDEVFGTDEPQPVGGRWSIHDDVAAQDLTEAGLAMDGTAVTGEAELERVETINETECLQIQIEMHTESFSPPGLQSGDHVEKADMNATFSGSFPTDRSRPPLSRQSTLSVELTVLRTLSGRPVRTEMRTQRSQTTQYDTSPEPPGDESA